MNDPLAAALVTALAVAFVVAVIVLRRNEELRRRPGDVPVRARLGDRGPWVRGHGVWVNDIFAFRRSPAGWTETLLWVTNATVCRATRDEAEGLAHLGDNPVVATFVLASGGSMAFAARAEDRAELLGPYA